MTEMIIGVIVGAIVAAGLGILIYSQRNRIGALRYSAQQQVSRTRERLSRSADARYRDAVIELANTLHIAGHLVPLEKIAVSLQFYIPPQPYNPLEEEPPGSDDPFTLLPFIPDWPHYLAGYQLPGLSLSQIMDGPGHVALLGLPGSGRTVTLALAAIAAARQASNPQTGKPRLPVLLHLGDVDLSPEYLGPDADPLLPLLDAGRARLRGLAGIALGAIKGQFEQGEGLILIDGWDELPQQRRYHVIEWLRALITTYPGNKLIVAGPVRGYAPLLELGLAPAFILPMGRPAFAELGRLWAAAWPEMAGTKKQPAPPPEPRVVQQAVRGCDSRTPLDAALKIWSALAGDDPAQGQCGWYKAYINRVSPAPELFGALAQMADLLFSAYNEFGLSIEKATTLVDSVRNSLPQKPSISTPDFIYFITSQTRLMTEYAGGRLAFTHPVVEAYLVAEASRTSPLREVLLERGDLVMPFLAQMQDMTPYVERRLAERDTILRDKLLMTALWVADADPQATWRAPIFKRLAQEMLVPAEFPLVRERAMAALVASRDPNVGYIFRQGLKNPDPRIRSLSAFGLGGMGDTEAVIALGELLNDEDAGVQVAAALALGAIGSKPALNYMIQILMEGNEVARRAIAQMLATNTAGEGHDILREAIQDQDPETRKAAVFGLLRIGSDWAFKMLEEAERHDSQWMVRTAASHALEALRTPPLKSPRPMPQPEELSWLVQWMEQRNRNVSPGAQGILDLVRALQEGDEPIRLAAAEALGGLGHPDSVTPLYAALRDTHPEIRDAAYRALGAVSGIMGRPLPSVT